MDNIKVNTYCAEYIKGLKHFYAKTGECRASSQLLLFEQLRNSLFFSQKSARPIKKHRFQQ